MKPIFVGGCQRSGTTMLGSILGGHSHIICVPEALFITDIYMNIKDDMFSFSEVWNSISNSKTFARQWDFNQREINFVEKKLNGVTTYRELIEIIINVYAKRNNKENYHYWVCHTPNNIIKSSILLEIFPEAQFLHIIRDGRAVANSFLKTDFGANTTYYATYQCIFR